MNMLSLYYDIAVVLIVFVCFLIFYIKGFVSSALGLVGSAGAAVGSYFIVRLFSQPVYDGFVHPWLLGKVTSKLEDFYAGGGAEGGLGNGLIGRAILKFVGVTAADMPLQEQAEKIVEGSLRNVAMTTIKLVMFAVCFLLVFLIIRVLAKKSKDINDAPVVGKLNKVLGGAFGLVIAVTVLLLGSALVSVLSRHFSAEWLSEEVIRGSYLFSFIYDNNPLIG